MEQVAERLAGWDGPEVRRGLAYDPGVQQTGLRILVEVGDLRGELGGQPFIISVEERDELSR